MEVLGDTKDGSLSHSICKDGSGGKGKKKPKMKRSPGGNSNGSC